jgi:RNA polymerase sigma-70 factor (ECF subfamily)
MKHEASPGSNLIGSLFDSQARALVLYARQLCADPHDAVQQAFLKLAEQRTAPQNPVAWLYRVVRNEALMMSRANQRRLHREACGAQAMNHWFQPSPADSLDATAAADALATLPLDQREIVTSHIWGGLSFSEIGALIGVSDSTAHRRYQEAILSLQKSLRVPTEQ